MTHPLIKNCPDYNERIPMCRACPTIIRIAEYKQFILNHYQQKAKVK